MPDLGGSGNGQAFSLIRSYEKPYARLRSVVGIGSIYAGDFMHALRKNMIFRADPHVTQLHPLALITKIDL